MYLCFPNHPSILRLFGPLHVNLSEYTNALHHRTYHGFCHIYLNFSRLLQLTLGYLYPRHSNLRSYSPLQTCSDQDPANDRSCLYAKHTAVRTRSFTHPLSFFISKLLSVYFQSLKTNLIVPLNPNGKL